MTDTSITLSELNQLPAEQFVKLLGGVFEHSPWVAEQAAVLRPFADINSLHQAMVECIVAAGPEAQLKLIRAHPELAGKAAVRGELTAESSTEQKGAGLDQCTQEEYSRLTALNQAYREKFGFPFILAVRGHDRQSIIREFQRRLALTPAQETAECLAQIYKIGRFRLDDLVREPSL
ncbi:MAG TPA: 2-oxo-4-hydroxy-4-carboxy-5-ureidoimidazoline decarboxylase [Pusillimonas sp.]|uniref:2-oxo-4-hydroxy-4-carboxy-5-ureidoimidazoline decarboxylase n=1 Tax=Pusillimonas sp. TaxID=3040095 RepID=UPI002BA0B145|nr:2-oxo-4-hydroxy-4-carboxy-5-ureidoimidazoline decarboxylase [Pusillimonas sp.]HUH87399.1 2-oxo-4-hydroxy-4-carboxy-5-ureidoimidazoline decarboxylase [Pusillimonas sp.]